MVRRFMLEEVMVLSAMTFIRPYFPKGSSFTNITNERIQEVEDKLNHRPREKL